MRCYASFVIRILWDDELNSILEGQISHVGTQETAYFRDLDRATAFIQDHLNSASETDQDPPADYPTRMPEGDVEDLRRG